MQREDMMTLGGGGSRQGEEVGRHSLPVQAIEANQLIQSGEGCGQLGAKAGVVVDDRDERGIAPAVGGPAYAGLVQVLKCGIVHLPAGGTMDFSRMSENLLEALLGQHHLAHCPRSGSLGHAVLPGHVVPGMDSRFEPCAGHAAHLVDPMLSNVGAWQQRAIQQGFQAIMFQHRSTLYLPQESFPENPFDGAPGMVRLQAEQKSRVRLACFQKGDQSGHPFKGAAQGIHINFEGQ